MKVCSKCKIPQPLENFSNNKNKKDGKDCQCKLCYKQWRENNKEKVALKLKQWRENNKEKVALKLKQWHKDNKEKVALKKKQWHKDNKEKLALKNKSRYKENKEKLALKNKSRYKENKEEILTKKKQYYEENKEKITLRVKKYSQTPDGRTVHKNAFHKRRTITKQGDVTTEQLRNLLDNSTHCFYCNNPLMLNEIHIDHYIPLSKGGLHTITNLRVSCQTCNQQKGHKMPEEFLALKRCKNGCKKIIINVN